MLPFGIVAMLAIVDIISLNMILPPLAAVTLWYALPLIVSVSLVCAATRHEEMGPILNHAVRFGLWIVVFMIVVMAVLWLMGLMV
jgi:hypothetical protein